MKKVGVNKFRLSIIFMSQDVETKKKSPRVGYHTLRGGVNAVATTCTLYYQKILVAAILAATCHLDFCKLKMLEAHIIKTPLQAVLRI